MHTFERAIEATRRGEVRALLARHGLPDAEPLLAPSQGDANRTYFAGSLVVRLPRPEILEDWRTECLAHPYAHARGIRTPEFVAAGEFYTILERTEGRNMAADAPPEAFFDLGHQLARLHALPFPADPKGVLDDLNPIPIELDGLPEPLRPLADRLRAFTDASGESFIHGDLTPGNVLFGPEGAVLLDWGDAGRGGRAYDFAQVPIPGLAFCLDGYGAPPEFRREVVALILSEAAREAAEDEPDALVRAIAARDRLERLTHA